MLSIKGSFLKGTIKGFGVCAASFGLLLLASDAAMSQTSKETPPRTSGRSGGTRGCEAREAIASTLPALMLLTPNHTTAKVTANSPTFAWFIRDRTPQPLTFRLYRYGPNSQTPRLVMQDDRLISKPGIMVMSLPQPQLTVGQRYLWQVEVICDPNRPSGNVFAEADVEVVTTDLTLATKLNTASNPRDRANLYLSAGLWHNALKLMLIGDRSTNAQKPTAQSSMPNQQAIDLLRQMAISDVELNSLKMSSIHQLHH